MYETKETRPEVADRLHYFVAGKEKKGIKSTPNCNKQVRACGDCVAFGPGTYKMKCA